MNSDDSGSAASVTVALLGSKDVGRELGKRGTVSDLTLYNSVREGHVATYVEPTQFPEKFPPLLYSLSMADRVLFFVPELSREIAETAATTDLFGKPVLVVQGPALDPAQLDRALRGSALEEAPRIPMDMLRIRDEVEHWRSSPEDGPVTVPIDHAFPVKGVGTVGLGLVTRGTLRIHDNLRLYPTDKLVEVRSIQVQDVDVKVAPSGRRVGVALKGIDPSELARGQTLAPEGSMEVSREITSSSVTLCPYYRGKIVDGTVLHLFLGLQSAPVRVVRRHEENLDLALDRPLAFRNGDQGMLADLSVTSGPRIAARVGV